MYAFLKFADRANGDPGKWNADGATMFWGLKTNKKLAQYGPLVEVNATEALHLFYYFLHERRNAFSQPLSRMFGVPQVFPDQWLRLSWLPFVGDDLRAELYTPPDTVFRQSVTHPCQQLHGSQLKLVSRCP